jgi:S1-C subfamily serine protease
MGKQKKDEPTVQSPSLSLWVKISIVLIIIIGISIIFIVNDFTNQVKSLNQSINGVTNNNHFSDVVTNVKDSVFMVAIPISSGYNPGLVDAIYTDEMGQGWKIGTGFVIKSNENSSYLLTAYHVVDGAQSMEIISKDLKSIRASRYKDMPDLDLAIIKVETKLKPVKIGKLGDIRVGSKVAFSGYPLNNPVVQITHEGIISFLGAYKNIPLITVNSFVNKGNSGGPLFLSDTGEVIGVINAREYKPLSQEPLEILELSNNDSKMINNNLVKISNQLTAMSENVQMGIGKATPIDQNIISLIKE